MRAWNLYFLALRDRVPCESAKKQNNRCANVRWNVVQKEKRSCLSDLRHYTLQPWIIAVCFSASKLVGFQFNSKAQMNSTLSCDGCCAHWIAGWVMWRLLSENSKTIEMANWLAYNSAEYAPDLLQHRSVEGSCFECNRVHLCKARNISFFAPKHMLCLFGYVGQYTSFSIS